MRPHSFVTVAAALSALALPARAHHSLEDNFDLTRTVTLTGHVSRVEWANPHVRLFVDARDTTGAVKTWVVEIKPPNAMAKLGVDATMLSQADIDLDVWLAKDGSLLASGRTLRMPDGTAHDVASGLNWRQAQ